MFSYGDRVVLKPTIDRFHYQETPLYSLASVLYKLQQNRTYGVVKRIAKEKDAIGVFFPGMKDFIWFKSYELQRL